MGRKGSRMAQRRFLDIAHSRSFDYHGCMVFKRGDKPWNVKYIDSHTRDRLIDLYLSGMSGAAAGRELGLTQYSAMKALTAAGVVRSVSEVKSANARGARAVGFDVAFWTSWSPGSAWVWGLVFGDGWVTKKDVHLSGSQKVIDLVKAVSGCRAKVYQREGCVSLYLGGLDMVEAAGRVGLTPGPKSSTIEWPEMPVEFDWHFIRGLWDSDGCWSTWRRGTYPLLTATLASNSRGMLEAVIEKAKIAGVKGSLSEPRDGHWHARFFGSNANSLGRIMYSESSEAIRCPRKWADSGVCQSGE